jgi:hypothetical protein
VINYEDLNESKKLTIDEFKKAMKVSDLSDEECQENIDVIYLTCMNLIKIMKGYEE